MIFKWKLQPSGMQLVVFQASAVFSLSSLSSFNLASTAPPCTPSPLSPKPLHSPPNTFGPSHLQSLPILFPSSSPIQVLPSRMLPFPPGQSSLPSSSSFFSLLLALEQSHSKTQCILLLFKACCLCFHVHWCIHVLTSISIPFAKYCSKCCRLSDEQD